MNQIAELRYNAGMSQSKLANLVGVNQTAVSQWERGVTTPSPSTLLRLCMVFNTTTDYLLGRKSDSNCDSMKWQDPETMEIITEGYDSQYKNLMENLSICSPKEVKMVADILMELRHVTGLVGKGNENREISIHVLRDVIGVTSRYLDSCITTDLNKSPDPARLAQQRQNYLDHLQELLEDAESQITCAGSD